MSLIVRALRYFADGSARTTERLAADLGLPEKQARVLRTDLVARRVLTDAGSLDVGKRGPKPQAFRLHAARGTVIVIQIGLSQVTVAACDLLGRVHSVSHEPHDRDHGPDDVIASAWQRASALAPRHQVWGVGVCIAAPVRYPEGRVARPPILRHWDMYDLRGVIARRTAQPVVVLNDARAAAYGEYLACTSRPQSLVYVKIGTGIGAGTVLNGRILHGVSGAAGDLGHTATDRSIAPEGTDDGCRCGRRGCVAAYAAGWAMARDLGFPDGPGSVTRVRDALLASDPRAQAVAARAGDVLGTALAHTVSMLNPDEVVLGGQLALPGPEGQPLLSRVRHQITQRALPLAAEAVHLRVSDLAETAVGRGIPASALGGEASRRGLVAAALDEVFNKPDLLARLLQPA
ncbi:hypothetical protein A7K94_0201720 [Modestobacter sp. VKM Ac-2676]|nr:hypothetical protein A7K94_0201720 [Modestobacter sp. VKM Ac-2676]